MREKKATLEKTKEKQRKPTAEPTFEKRSLLSSFLKLIRTKQRSKKGLFSSIFLLNIAFKPHKRQGSQFPRQNYKSKRWRSYEGENQYCINIFFYSFLYYLLFFVVLFNFLFDSIYFYFYFCVDYLLIIFLLFLIFWWVEWCKSMVEMHKDPWYAMG